MTAREAVYLKDAVVGIIGREEGLPPNWRSFLFPRGATHLTIGAGQIWTDLPTEGFASGEIDGQSWMAAFPGEPLRDATDARLRRGAQSLIRHGKLTTLAQSLWGHCPLFYRLYDGVVVFSTRIEAVAYLGGSALTPDWDAWASILTARSPLGPRTPFEQIRRLEGSQALVYDDDTSDIFCRRHELPIVESGGTSLDTLIDSLEWATAASPAGYGDRKVLSLLSGGWDSRVLFSLALRSRLPRMMEVATTSKNRGFDDPDVRISGAIAGSAGVSHRFVAMPNGTYSDYAQSAMENFGYETWEHLWLGPLAEYARARLLPVIDGLAGDVLLKNNSVSPDAARSQSHSEIGDLIWGHLSTGVPQRAVLRPSSTNVLEEQARASFDESRAHLQGMEEEARLTVLICRTFRTVALGPFALFAPHVEVAAPFMHVDVASVALAFDPASKDNGALLRRLLGSLDARLARVPSTNDRAPLPTFTSRRQEDAISARWRWEVISAFADEVGRSRPAVSDLIETDKATTTWINGLVLFQLWRDRYRDVLATSEPPWW